MKLEVGKKYVDGFGRTLACIADRRDWFSYAGVYPFLCMDIKSGRVGEYSGKGCFELGEDYRLIREVTPYDHLKRGDPVWAWDEGWLPIKEQGHFSHIDEDGKPRIFREGCSSWTSQSWLEGGADDRTLPYDHVRLATPEELSYICQAHADNPDAQPETVWQQGFAAAERCLAYDLEAALKREKQEPVAWMYSNEEGDDDFTNVPTFAERQFYKGGPPIPLYAEPPQESSHE